jgi:hypothetical protein
MFLLIFLENFVHNFYVDSWREAHFVSWICFIVKISFSPKETKHRIKKSLNASSLLSNCHIELIKSFGHFKFKLIYKILKILFKLLLNAISFLKYSNSILFKLSNCRCVINWCIWLSWLSKPNALTT